MYGGHSGGAGGVGVGGGVVNEQAPRCRDADARPRRAVGAVATRPRRRGTPVVALALGVALVHRRERRLYLIELGEEVERAALPD